MKTNLKSFNAFNLTKGLKDNTVTVIAKKQYGTDKLENIIIESDSQKININIEDSEYLHELLGDNTYETILRKDYPHEYLRAEEAPQLRSVHIPTFDCTFSALTPELMLFWPEEKSRADGMSLSLAILVSKRSTCRSGREGRGQ